MSADYYSRLERGHGPQPSEKMVTAIANGLRLTLDQRDHLFLLAGYKAPVRVPRDDHVNPGVTRILHRLEDTPAMVMSEIGEVLLQTQLAVALYGDRTGCKGLERNMTYRWFMEPTDRERFEPTEWDLHGRVHAAALRKAVARAGETSAAWTLAERLRWESAEFAKYWSDHEVGVTYPGKKCFIHPKVGRLTLEFQTLLDPDLSQRLLVFTARPGTEDHEKLEDLNRFSNETAAV
jgi:transcriptional regulator with XRE-family HTH domain